MDPRRARRVSESLREELAELISYELNDPRVAIVDVTDVQVAPDMKKAVGQVTFTGEPQERDAALEALEHARHFLRRQLAKRLQLFRMPELHFEPVMALGSPARVEQLLKRIQKGRPRDAAADPESPAGPNPEKNPVE
jgi:ribosome-binding factor A